MHSRLPPLFLTLLSLARFQLLNIKLRNFPLYFPFPPVSSTSPNPYSPGLSSPLSSPCTLSAGNVESPSANARGGGGGGEEGVGLRNFPVQTFILYAAPAANNFFGVSVFLQTLLFTCIHFISVLTASANNLFYNFPTAALLLSVKK